MTTSDRCHRRERPLLAYMRAIASLAARDRAVLVVLVLSQLLFLLPMIASYPTGEEAICRERAIESAGVARDELLRYGNEFPDDLRELTRQEYKGFSTAAAASYPSSAYFSAFGAAREAQDREWQAGYLTGGLIYKASATLLTKLSELDDPQVYSSARELPMLNYLALGLGVMPAITLLLPSALLAYATLKRLHGHGLLAVAPIGERTRNAGAALVASLLSALGPLAVMLPSALVALARNGLGDPAYPVVSITEGVVVSGSVLGTIGKDVAIALLEVVAIALFMGLVNRIGPRAALGAGLLFLAVPLLPLYSSGSMPWHELGSLLPMTYLGLDHVVGYPTYTNGLDILLFSGATFERGVAVLLVTAALLSLISAAIDFTGNVTRARRLERRASQ